MSDEHTMFEYTNDLKKQLSDTINSENFTDVAEVARYSENGTYRSGLGTVTIRKSRKRINIHITYSGNMGSRRESVNEAVDVIFGIPDSLHKLKYHPAAVKYETKGSFDYLYEIEIQVTK